MNKKSYIGQIILGLFFAGVMVFLGVIFHHSVDATKKCREQGGTTIRTTKGYECAKLEVIEQ